MHVLFVLGLIVCSTLSLIVNANVIPEQDGHHHNTLKQLHIIFRHGDRAPVNLYPTDPNEGHVWEFGTGQLTSEGKRQQYELGTFLRNRYNGFLTTDPREVQARSSDKDRTIASTQVNLAAFYKPEGKWIWNNDLQWQPVPIRTIPKKWDWVLNEDADCPAADVEAAKFLTSETGRQFTQKYGELMNTLQTNGGMPVNDPTSLLDIQGTIMIERIKGLLMPEWMNDDLWHQMEAAANDAFTAKYACKKIQRLRGGPLLNHFTELMKQRASTNEDSDPKAFIYSTHDAIIAALMSAMGVFNNHTVPYCATIMVELHHLEPNGDNVVRMYYRNGTDHEPAQLHVPGCALDCPLTQFVTLLDDVTPHDIKNECKQVAHPAEPDSHSGVNVAVGTDGASINTGLGTAHLSAPI